MSRTVTIQSSELSLEISTFGAEILSLRDKNGREYIWEGDPAIWGRRAPVLFPICGGLADGKYILNDRKYKLDKHGFAKKLDFKLESQSKSRAVFLLTECEETLISYPFRFELRAIFELSNTKLTVTYDVKNNSDTTMYYSCGGHEAYALPEGIDGCQVIFDKAETLNNYKVEQGILSTHFETILENSHALVLSKNHFESDALIFKELASRSVTLVNSTGDRRIRVDFDGFDHLLLWQVSGAKYLCIEPWTGLPDIIGTDGDFSHKESTSSLESGASAAYTHHITILD
ncbi:MAG: aldose 1-epimerase family protein [Clostridia bacterium]|nr:aldose 1-epimerase family protein [Clostridia bacterium]